MYGASNDTYEKMCGCPNGFDKFKDGVRKIKTLPSLLETRTTIIKDNFADLPAMREFTKKEFGEDKKLTISRFVASTVRDGIANPVECRLTPEQNMEMIYSDLFKLRDRILSGKNLLPKNIKKFDAPKKSPTKDGAFLFEQCGACVNKYSIGWDGKMFGCELMSGYYTYPFETSFNEAWKKLPDLYPKAKPIEKCDNCEKTYFCEACPATRLAETGSWFGVPEYSCREAEHLYKMMKDLGAV